MGKVSIPQRNVAWTLWEMVLRLIGLWAKEGVVGLYIDDGRPDRGPIMYMEISRAEAFTSAPWDLSKEGFMHHENVRAAICKMIDTGVAQPHGYVATIGDKVYYCAVSSNLPVFQDEETAAFGVEYLTRKG